MGPFCQAGRGWPRPLGGRGRGVCGLGSLGADLLLLLAAVLWWRCLLDTWNADYYALGGLTALAGWSALRGRFPTTALVATVAAYVSFLGAGAWWNVSPDLHTAIYLGWALPLGIGMSWAAVAPQRWGRTRVGWSRRRPITPTVPATATAQPSRRAPRFRS